MYLIFTNNFFAEDIFNEKLVVVGFTVVITNHQSPHQCVVWYAPIDLRRLKYTDVLNIKLLTVSFQVNNKEVPT